MSSNSTDDIQMKINEEDIDEINNEVDENKNEENDENDEEDNVNNDNEEENEEDNEDDADEDADDNIIDDDEDEDDDEFSLDEDGEEVVTKTVGKKSASSKKTKVTSTGSSDNIMDFLNVDNEEESSDEEDDGHMNGIMEDDDYDDYDDDEDPDVYFQKFDEEINRNYLLEQHPTEFNKNYDEIETLCNIIRDENNNIIDPLHKTLPYLSKYERTRVLGQRAKQINSGAKPFVPVPDSIIDGFIIAEMELVQKRIPFIIQRPLHGGACEYWKLRDLEIL
jgi:DNA-directed RNA polymerase subunit K/omega